MLLLIHDHPQHNNKIRSTAQLQHEFHHLKYLLHSTFESFPLQSLVQCLSIQHAQVLSYHVMVHKNRAEHNPRNKTLTEHLHYSYKCHLFLKCRPHMNRHHFPFPVALLFQHDEHELVQSKSSFLMVFVTYLLKCVCFHERSPRYHSHVILNSSHERSPYLSHHLLS